MAATKHIPPSSQLPKRARRTNIKAPISPALPGTNSSRPKPKPKPTTTTFKPNRTTTTTKSPHFPPPPTPSITATTIATKPTKPPTPHQHLTYAHLLLIPRGRITSYAALSRSPSLSSSPRAIGGALRCNPFAPSVPCHRVIAANGFVGGFMGDWEKAPSGVNQSKKLELLKGEGVEFDEKGRLLGGEELWFDGPWDVSGTVGEVDRRIEEMMNGTKEGG